MRRVAWASRRIGASTPRASRIATPAASSTDSAAMIQVARSCWARKAWSAPRARACAAGSPASRRSGRCDAAHATANPGRAAGRRRQSGRARHRAARSADACRALRQADAAAGDRRHPEAAAADRAAARPRRRSEGRHRLGITAWTAEWPRMRAADLAPDQAVPGLPVIAQDIPVPMLGIDRFDALGKHRHALGFASVDVVEKVGVETPAHRRAHGERDDHAQREQRDEQLGGDAERRTHESIRAARRRNNRKRLRAGQRPSSHPLAVPLSGRPSVILPVSPLPDAVNGTARDDTSIPSAALAVSG